METFSALLAFVWGIHRSPVNSPHKGQWRRALMFSLICTWINCWVNNREAGDLRGHCDHYDVIVMVTLHERHGVPCHNFIMSHPCILGFHKFHHHVHVLADPPGTLYAHCELVPGLSYADFRVKVMSISFHHGDVTRAPWRHRSPTDRPFNTLSIWWRHQMETFSALLDLCEGNSTVTGEFPSQRPVTQSFDVLFDLRLNKWLSKPSTRWWFGTPSLSLWRHCNVI